MYRKIHLRTNPYLIKDGKYYPETRDDIHWCGITVIGRMLQVP